MLEELKEIRSEAVKLSSRVGKFKSELEDVMQDDSDMLVLPRPCTCPAHVPAADPLPAVHRSGRLGVAPCWLPPLLHTGVCQNNRKDACLYA